MRRVFSAAVALTMVFCFGAAAFADAGAGQLADVDAGQLADAGAAQVADAGAAQVANVDADAGQIADAGAAQVADADAVQLADADAVQIADAGAGQLADVGAGQVATEINSIEDFLNIKNNPGGSYVLNADLDFSKEAVSYEPFEFFGCFDGNGHYIKGAVVSGSKITRKVFDANLKEYDAVCSGLFAVLENATVKNLKLYDLKISEELSQESVFAGAAAGYANDSQIINCEIYSNVKAVTAGHCFGVAGVIGFSGNCSIDDCIVDAELICIDTDTVYKDEQFMGGVYSFGYGSIRNCKVHVEGYDSDHGFVHDGGLVGCFMYYDKQHVGEMQLLGNRVDGRINFFEDNKNRRAYCEAYIGERMSWDYEWSGNSENFLRNETKNYSENLLPEFEWEPAPIESTDILLISSHADDEQLFFAGLLPYYSQVRDLSVQVLYATDHAESTGRNQERERGLWNVGIKTKPASLRYYDDAATVNSKTYTDALKVFAKYKITEESFIDDLHRMIMKYKPQVIVSHDVAGEYGHGMHILVNTMIQKCIEKHSSDYDFLKKVYFHLYDENPVTLSVIDEPSDKLEGKTPFQITQEKGFAEHKSQHWTWFYGWIYGKNGNAITSASQIKTYSPLNYGLYYGNALLDVNKNDLFEGLKSYEQIETERIEEEKRLAEEAARKAEEERIAAEEAARAEEERLAKEARNKKIKSVALIIIGCILIITGITTIVKARKKNEMR